MEIRAGDARKRPRSAYEEEEEEEEGQEGEHGHYGLGSVLEGLASVLATDPYAAGRVCGAGDPALADFCRRTWVPVTEGVLGQTVSLADLPALYAPETDVVRCALWRWAAAFTASRVHPGLVGDVHAPPLLADLYPARAGLVPRLVLPEQEDGRATETYEEGMAWREPPYGPEYRWLVDRIAPDAPGPLALLPYGDAPRNDLLLWATLAPATVVALPDRARSMLEAADVIAEAVRDPDAIDPIDAIDAASSLCAGGRLFAAMQTADALGWWGLPERERVDALPGPTAAGAVLSFDEAAAVDREVPTGEGIDVFTALVVAPERRRGSSEYGRNGDDVNVGEDDDDEEARTAWVARLPGPTPLDADALQRRGLLAPLVRAASRTDGMGGRTLYAVLASDEFAEAALNVVSEAIDDLSAPAVAARAASGDRGARLPSACASLGRGGTVAALPIEVYATYMADDGSGRPGVVLWTRVVFDRSLVDPDGTDWWQ
jgi:hypothetical protein